jgi:hypothetical protein
MKALPRVSSVISLRRELGGQMIFGEPRVPTAHRLATQAACPYRMFGPANDAGEVSILAEHASTGDVRA